MKPGRTPWLLAAGAVLTGALIWFAPAKDDLGVSEPAKGGATLKLRPSLPASSPLEAAASKLDQALKGAPERASLKQKSATALFAQSSWVVVPPPPKPLPPAPPPPPPPPTAPAVPYAFMGQFQQGETLLVILTRGNRVITAAQGDVLEKTYRIDRIEASKVTLTYLPLGVSQSLSTGGSQ